MENSTPPFSPSPSLFRRILPALILVVAITIIYAPVIRYDFIEWDDRLHTFDNPRYNPVTLNNIRLFWTEPYRHHYVPLTYTVWGGLSLLARRPAEAPPVSTMTALFDPGIFHLANLAVHVINALLIWLLLRRFFSDSKVALAGALLWALHPLQVESVAWVSELRGLLSACFGLTAMNLYFAGNPPGAIRPQWKYYVAALFCLLLALLSKPSAVSFALMTWALDFWLNRGSLSMREAIVSSSLRMAPWIVMNVPFVLITSRAQPTPSSLSPLAARPLVCMDALSFYVGKIIYPENFQIIYGRTPAALLGSWWGYTTWILPVALFLLAWRYRHIFPYAVAAVFVYAAGLMPNLGIFPFIFQRYSTVADRYAYLAMLGPAILLCALLTKLQGESQEYLKRDKMDARRWAFRACFVWLIVLGWRTTCQVGNWKNNEALWSYNLSANPLNWGMWNNIGTLYLENGKPEAAVPYFRRAMQIRPDIIFLTTNLGDALMRSGKTAEAAEAYQKAVDLDAHASEPRVLLGNIRRAQGKQDEALKLYQEALKLDRNSQEAHYNLGVLLADSGQLPEAISHFQEALRIEPDAATHDVLALALARSGDVKKAREHWDQALKLEPRYAPALINMGTLMAMQKDYKSAAEKWALALQIDPTNAEVHHNLASLLMAQGHTKEAIEHWKTALKLKPDYPEAKEALDKALHSSTH